MAHARGEIREAGAENKELRGWRKWTAQCGRNRRTGVAWVFFRRLMSPTLVDAADPTPSFLPLRDSKYIVW